MWVLRKLIYDFYAWEDRRHFNYYMGLGILIETLIAIESPLKTLAENKQNKCKPLEFLCKKEKEYPYWKKIPRE